MADESPFVLVKQDRGTFVIRPRAMRDQSTVKRTASDVPLLTPASESLTAIAGRLRQLEGNGDGAMVDLGHHRDASDGRPFELTVDRAALSGRIGPGAPGGCGVQGQGTGCCSCQGSWVVS